ncbi:5-formyltetrahydrofolate cyclo-ligase [Caldalkalibacillus thermarum TA2.A1]|uniref:5-formyltetrahydrofolate cyclo-ligase n=1 Tax=Caldalkalibacillus thermarum (strain TA2.A1) TaxID=986075 RepID=F5L7W0_CALTT|nr:5-formyltetrahydrofolate cyclo-ligase [Caldalkalibacillus thermarum]EGL82548.1 5-formyltetrahydrofolate cyclo-ligase [Caldalkalibacillus thermarum TA2.A1]QZT34799.1 5-formyltetrahydrofolate cyclo-ligase [Caldalkalibacillus thermarum TA2.A1]
MGTDKHRIRQMVWDKMEQEKVGRFPFPLQHRIPNFKGAEQAAHHLTQLPVYKQAKTVKVNPDAPQLPLRTQVLIDGKTLLVPTPRLKAGFIQIKPEWVPKGEERKAASLSHIQSYGRELPLSELPSIDLIVVGSVAVNRDGPRVGKGEGYADREYAILRELGHPPVPVVTTVHSIQVVEDSIPIDSYDLTVDFIVTEQGVLETNSPYPKPEGIDWERVTEEEKQEMPVLEEVWKLQQDKKHRI